MTFELKTGNISLGLLIGLSLLQSSNMKASYKLSIHAYREALVYVLAFVSATADSHRFST